MVLENEDKKLIFSEVIDESISENHNNQINGNNDSLVDEKGQLLIHSDSKFIDSVINKFSLAKKKVGKIIKPGHLK